MHQGCQYIARVHPYPTEFVQLGSSASYEWHVVNTTYFYILFKDGDPPDFSPIGRYSQ